MTTTAPQPTATTGLVDRARALQPLLSAHRVEHDRTGQLADDVGFDRLTLALLAQRLGVALPSLYKHVKGLDDVRQKLSAQATGELASELGAAAAGRAGLEALVAVADDARVVLSEQIRNSILQVTHS